MRSRPAALAAALILSAASTSALAGVRLGVSVRNVEGIPGAHVVAVDSSAPGGSILKMKSGDLIRFVRVDDSGAIWRTPEMLDLIRALRQTKRKVTVYYLRGGAWQKGGDPPRREARRGRTRRRRRRGEALRRPARDRGGGRRTPLAGRLISPASGPMRSPGNSGGFQTPHSRFQILINS